MTLCVPARNYGRISVQHSGQVRFTFLLLTGVSVVDKPHLAVHHLTNCL